MGRLASLLARLRWTLLVVSVAACAKASPPPWPDAARLEPAFIEASSDTVAISPGGSHQLDFQLWDAQRTPIPGAVVSFSILDNQETPGSGGARLSLSRGLTDEQGVVALQVIAGEGSKDQKPLSFWVRASVDTLERILPIFVTSGDLAKVEIVPVVEEATLGEEALASTSLYFYDDTTCSDVSWENPAPSIRQERLLPPEIQSAVFSNVVTSGIHAVLAVAKGASNRVVAQGCADLPGAGLSPNQVMRVLLPLTRLHVSPVGTYQVQAYFKMAAQQPGIAVRDEWKVFSSQACDPAGIWLDCTIDALSGESSADPIDCMPVPGGEGALGDLLSAKRSIKGGGPACANQVDGTGAISLDAKAYTLFPAGFLAPLNLAKLPDELGNALSQLSLQSTLTVAESSLADVMDIEHTLDTLSLSGASNQVISAASLGLPVRSVWFASRQTRAGQLELASHGFTLRLGSLARLVFARSSLASRLGVADTRTFISSLFGSTTRNAHSTLLHGCDALDSLLCEEAGLDRGCIVAACLAGLEKLGQRLDSSFGMLDGPNLDFFLSGWASMLDSNGDGRADELKSSLMTATFSSAQFSSTVYGVWSAERVSASAP